MQHTVGKDLKIVLQCYITQPKDFKMSFTKRKRKNCSCLTTIDQAGQKNCS